MKIIKKDIDLDMCIKKIAEQDYCALEQVYNELKNPIYRFSLMILNDSGLAEDAMQNTFLKIMVNAEQYRLGTNPRAWIFSISRNVCMDLLKKKVYTVDESVFYNLLESESMNNLTEVIAVKDAISRLSLIEQEILSLNVFSGLKQTEIAKVMNMPYLKVRSIYGYAIKKLRKELGD